MTHRLTNCLTRLAAILLLTFALAATGFAHRAPSAQDVSLQIAQAMGGMAGFCGQAPEGERPGHVKCPACQLTEAASLPPVAKLPIAAPRVTEVLAPAVPKNPFFPVLDPSHGSRAPPLA